MSGRSPVRTTLAFVLLMFAILLAPPAWAHATLVDSSPHRGERLDILPAQIQLEFSEEMMTPANVVVTGPDGSSVTSGSPVVEGSVVRQALVPGPNGAYTLAYRAVSRDGHPLTGEISFVVGDQTTPPTDAATTLPSTGENNDTNGSVEEATDGAAVDSVAAAETPLSRDGWAALVGALLFAGAGALYLASRRVRG